MPDSTKEFERVITLKKKNPADKIEIQYGILRGKVQHTLISLVQISAPFDFIFKYGSVLFFGQRDILI